MSKQNRIFLVLALILALLATTVQTLVFSSKEMENIAGVTWAGAGESVTALYQGNNLMLYRMDSKGMVQQTVSISTHKGDTVLSLGDMAVDENGIIYLLENYSDAKTGKRLSQSLSVYDPGRMFFQQMQSHPLNTSSGNDYRWLSISGSVNVIGIDRDGKMLIRDVYDPDAVCGREALQPKTNRTYALAPSEGIFQAVPAGTEVAYTSASGKLFVTSSQSPDAPAREVYPARVLERVMYPIFLCPQSMESVYIGEQESGDLLTLNLADGSASLHKSGGEPFGGGSYAPRDLLRMSMADPQNFVGVVRDKASDGYALLISDNGQTILQNQIRQGSLSTVVGYLLSLVGWLIGLLLAFQIVAGMIRVISKGRTILVKLAFSTIPLLIVAMVLFGVFSYQTYQKSILLSFQKQVVDEGNMLMALFGTESFAEIEFPYDYTGEAYGYLLNQIKTRSTYTRTAYYERNTLYIGTAQDLPCFYPFDILTNRESSRLYREAAFTGTPKMGQIRDANGERLVCVTPIGGVSGETIYLLETGIPLGNLRAYTSTYLVNYMVASGIFLAVTSVLLLLVFIRNLSPIGRIKEGLEEFARGNRAIRLENTSSDEFSDIIRVFNKMAGDIDVQIYNLRQASETYYRFVPPSLFHLLGRENLGELELGSGVEEERYFLYATLSFQAEKFPVKQAEEIGNQFFHILNEVCKEHSAVLLPDSINLRKLCLLCPGGGQKAVDIALSALSRVDAANAQNLMQNRMDVLFVVHKAHAYYGIGGDQARLVPTLLSSEADHLILQEKRLRQFSSRLLVTTAAYAGMEVGNYFHRYIGCQGDAPEETFGLYDFYDGNTPEEIRLINETLGTFKKAMELYSQGRYYDAKNLFAMVLRENQYDNVARYYIFSCESFL